ncbi:hypothetical protein NMY22_g4581 [Coprinellus aureogranulatus]|nr:hypothetical protein NMY22_g4581 [Coprinellus aureogranulatus]
MENALYKDTKYISQEAEWFLAGFLEGIGDAMPMLVPTINGYKRLTAGENMFWGSNAVSYAYEYREASVRILAPPSCPPQATRFEVRIGGADINPYYALSAIIQLGMRGIEKKSKLGPPITEYGPQDKQAGRVKMLPTSLEEATRRMVQPGSIAREVLGDEFVDHHGATRKHEVRQWNEAVTNWELERYLELV